MVFATAGMGGGTGTGAISIVARTAKELGILTVAVVTKPFFFEGAQRMRIADQGLEDLRREVDAMVVIPNDRLLGLVQKETTLGNAFAMSDEILRQAVEGISDLITTPGIINVDFADIRAIMENAGPALMGIGTASGEKRATEAARLAINSPLLDISINGARGILFAVAGGDEMTMFEIQEAAKVVTESIDKDAKVIFGAIKDEKLKKNEIKVTVIATGFPTEFVARTAGRTEETIAQKPQPNVEEPKKGRIYNDFNFEENREPNFKEKPNSVPQQQSSPSSQSKEVIEDDDSDSEWGVPAFLRRSKLK
jgi:cell division protein FtsZ